MRKTHSQIVRKQIRNMAQYEWGLNMKKSLIYKSVTEVKKYWKIFIWNEL
jgi:hypothetical protein